MYTQTHAYIHMHTNTYAGSSPELISGRLSCSTEDPETNPATLTNLEGHR